MDRRVVRWDKQQRTLVGELQEKIEYLFHGHRSLLSPHMKRVGSICAQMAVKSGWPDDECLLAAVGGLTHDIGKNHPECKKWLEAHRGVKNVPRDEINHFNQLHGALGRVVLLGQQPGFLQDRIDFISYICQHHHTPHNQLVGRWARIADIVRVADGYDVGTNPDEEHDYTEPIEEAKVIRGLFALGSEGKYSIHAVQALAFCRGLSAH